MSGVKLLRMAGEVNIPLCLDHEVCKKMSDLVEELTTSGQATLDQDRMKQFKKLCKLVSSCDICQL